MLKPAAIATAAVIAAGFVFAPSAPAKTHCVDGSAEEARVSGSDEGPPKFTPAFVSRGDDTRHVGGRPRQGTLPISIEAICGLPRSLDKQAGALAGGDGIALVTSRTSVWKDDLRLAGAAKLLELEGADTVTLRARMVQQAAWKTDGTASPCRPSELRESSSRTRRAAPAGASRARAFLRPPGSRPRAGHQAPPPGRASRRGRAHRRRHRRCRSREPRCEGIPSRRTRSRRRRSRARASDVGESLGDDEVRARFDLRENAASVMSTATGRSRRATTVSTPARNPPRVRTDGRIP